MVPEKQIEDFIRRLREVSAENLRSVVLYGSAAGGDFRPGSSNVNLLCILKEISFGRLHALAPVVQSWTRQKHPAPLFMTLEELERSTDVFSIELLDMQHHHRVLFGEPVLSGLKIPMHLHRAQLEYELREKLILLRERMMLAAGSDDRLWELLLGSISAFGTLFRHALIALGETPPPHKREAIEALAKRIQFESSAFLQVMDIRGNKADRKQFDLEELAARYLKGVQEVTAAVDKMLDAPNAA
jgi:hypothetical protein